MDCTAYVKCALQAYTGSCLRYAIYLDGFYLTEDTAGDDDLPAGMDTEESSMAKLYRSLEYRAISKVFHE